VTGRRKAVEPLAAVAAVLSAAGLVAVVACGYGFTRPEQPVTVERATALVGHRHRQAWVVWSCAVRRPAARNTHRVRLLSPCSVGQTVEVRDLGRDRVLSDHELGLPGLSGVAWAAFGRSVRAGVDRRRRRPGGAGRHAAR
jgi:hypothetical protein